MAAAAKGPAAADRMLKTVPRLPVDAWVSCSGVKVGVVVVVLVVVTGSALVEQRAVFFVFCFFGGRGGRGRAALVVSAFLLDCGGE